MPNQQFLHTPPRLLLLLLSLLPTLLVATAVAVRADSRVVSAELPTGFYVRATIDGLNAPTDLTPLPDGRLLVTEKGAGRDADAVAVVRLVENGSVRATPVVTVSVNTAGDSGLLAVALDREFAENGYFYLYYAAGNNALDAPSRTVNRLSRFTFDAARGTADPASELILLDDLPWTILHNGGGLVVDGEGLLYLAIGDVNRPDEVDDLDAFNGKILRIQPTADGYEVPRNNPYADKEDALPEIYALGVRSPFRATVERSTDTVYVADVGAGTWEEVNRLARRAHYGWPEREGPCPYGTFLPCPPASDDYVDPIIYYPHPPAEDGIPLGSSLTGLAVYEGSALPAAYHGGFFMADLNLGTITVGSLTADGFAIAPFADNLPGIVDLEFINDELYYLHIFDGKIGIISHSNVNNRIPVAQLAVSPQLGPAPHTVVLDGSGSYDPDGDALLYSWDFGDGTPVFVGADAVVTRTYTADANYTVTLQALDANGGLSEPVARTVTVYSGALPEIQLANLTTPGRPMYHGGDVWEYAAVRETGLDGLDSAAPYSWDVYLHHNQHAHPILQGNVTISDTLAIDTDNHDSEWNLWYRIVLTMKVETGQDIQVERSIYPALVNLTVDSAPPGQPINLNRAVVTARTRLKTIVGTEHTLAAPTQVVMAGGVGLFDHWYVFADGWPVQSAGAGTLLPTGTITITAPVTDTSYTAYYRYDRPAANVFLPWIER